MENIYKTPGAPLVETRGAKWAHFSIISLGKTNVLPSVTLGLYGVYWMYEHWRAQQPQMRRRINPIRQAVFDIFSSHALAQRIHQALPEERRALWSPSKDAVWTVLPTVVVNPINHLTDVVSVLRPYSLPSLLLLLMPLIPMYNIQRQANFVSGDLQGTGNAGYSGYNLLFIVFDTLYWLLTLIGSAVTPFGSSQG